jgi:hypothetical protein
MTAVFRNGHFTMQFELYIIQEDNIINSYAISTKADINEVMPLINDKVNEIVFYGQLGIYKKIEKEIKNNRPEVNILWQ